MAYRLISGIVPQLAKNAGGAAAGGYYLKGYAAGTDTPLSMGTDVTPSSTLVKCKLNARGEPISNDADETTVFIPTFNADYKLALYATSADADANNTAAALWVVDNIEYGSSSQIPLTINGATTNVQTYLNAQYVDDLAALRSNLAAEIYGVGAVVYVRSTGGPVFIVESIGSNVDDGGIIIAGGSFAAIREHNSLVDLAWYEIVQGTDITVALVNAVNYLSANTGGTISIPLAPITDRYSISADLSGVRDYNININLNGNQITSSNSDYIIKCNNSANGQVTTRLTFLNGMFAGLDTADKGVWCIHTSGITFRNIIFLQFLESGFYGDFAQYSEFYNCDIGANTYDASSCGVTLTGPSSSLRSNECVFSYCKFSSNRTGLAILGAEKVRVDNCRFQDHRSGATLGGAIYLSADAGGNGCSAVHIVGCWFEINNLRDIYVQIATDITLERNFFTTANLSVETPNKVASVESTHTYGINYIRNTHLTANAPVFAHPFGNADVARLAFEGNNVLPEYSGLVHSGITYVNGSRTNDKNYSSIWAGNTGYNRPVISEKAVFTKNGLAFGVGGDVFRIVRNAAPSAYDSFSVKVKIEAINDDAATTNTGYAGIYKEVIMMFTNNSSALNYIGQAAITTIPLSISAVFASISDVILTVTPSGSNVDVSMDYTRSGSNPTILSRIQVICKVETIGTEMISVEQL